MGDPNWLLATLSQCAAGIVAIIGGFLVSRLVALSSEREGVKRQLREAESRNGQARVAYDAAHQARREQSESSFLGFVIDDLSKMVAELSDIDVDSLVDDNIPRGSNEAEMKEYASRLINEAVQVRESISRYIKATDRKGEVHLEDLCERGLSVPNVQEYLYEHVSYELLKRLPERKRSGMLVDIPAFVMPPMQVAGSHEVEMRRFDETIAKEYETQAALDASAGDVVRNNDELRKLAAPVGVVQAVWVLISLAVLGILPPIIVMAFDPKVVPFIGKLGLIALFVLSLAILLSYVVWYFRKLKR